MLILDTNVVSELASPEPHPQVLSWLSGQLGTDLYITSVNEAELLFGVERLPAGRRRDAIALANDRVISEVFGERILPFDRAAVRAYAEIRVARERAGRPFGENMHRDCMIAAIARVNGASVATRDTGGFDDCGIQVINPWAN